MMRSLARSSRVRKPLRVERAEIAGVQPAAAQRRRRRLRQVPVAGHDGVAAHHDFADLAGRQRPVVGIDDGDLDSGAREADGDHARFVAGGDRRGEQRLGHGGDGAGALALAVAVPQPRAERRIARLSDRRRRPAPRRAGRCGCSRSARPRRRDRAASGEARRRQRRKSRCDGGAAGRRVRRARSRRSAAEPDGSPWRCARGRTGPSRATARRDGDACRRASSASTSAR